MRIPRDLSGDDLVKKLQTLGYEPTRQTGSHIRLTREGPEGSHHLTVPRHNTLRIGTLNKILAEVANHLGISKNELVQLVSG